MSDSGLSKSAKKNAKRRAKKAAGGGVESTPTDHPPPPTVAIATKQEEPAVKARSQPVDPIADLKRQIEEAKLAKDHEKTQRLRQQLWVLQDTMATGSAGPGAPEIDASLLPQQVPSEQLRAPPSGGSAGLSDPTEKKIHRLRKKLEAINTLKEKRDCGEKLEANQLVKLEKEAELLEEIHFLEELLQQPQLQ